MGRYNVINVGSLGIVQEFFLLNDKEDLVLLQEVHWLKGHVTNNNPNDLNNHKGGNFVK